jgi:uncharacterized protein involved in response to NO
MLKSFWQTFSAAPHRMMFFGGMLQLVLTIAWWLTELLSMYGLVGDLRTNFLPSTWLHAFLMMYSLFIFFIFGFLMTTYPRWMRWQVIPYKRYVTTFLFLIASILVIYTSLFLNNKTVLVIGIILLLLGYSSGLYALFQVYIHAPIAFRYKFHETNLNIALIFGWLGILSYLLYILIDNIWLINFSLNAGIWLFLIPVLLTVGHRMIPFFSSSALHNYQASQPKYSLEIMWFCVIGHMILITLNQISWLFIFDIPFMLLAFYHSYKWNLRRSFEVRILAVLHISFAWLGIALLLYNIQSLTMLITGEFILGKAPLHAITIGFMASLVVGMASRVTLGHSGRQLYADLLTWIAFLGISVSAITRILADMPILPTKIISHVNLLAATIWLVFALIWVSKYMPIVLKKRIDGNPG